jgi:predicted DNA-binding transcriptional regulator AlpA
MSGARSVSTVAGAVPRGAGARRRIEPMLSAEDVAGLLSMSLRWVRSQIAGGAFPRARRMGAAVRVPEGDVSAWIERQPLAFGSCGGSSVGAGRRPRGARPGLVHGGARPLSASSPAGHGHPAGAFISDSAGGAPGGDAA